MDIVKPFLFFAGIDVSGSWLDIALLVPDRGIVHQQRIDNTPKDIRAWLKQLFKEHRIHMKRVLFCMEHTGKYNHPFLTVAASKGINVWVEYPLLIKRSMGLARGKTDKWDATRIAWYANRFADKARLWKPLAKPIEKIKKHQSKRSLLVKTYLQLSHDNKTEPFFKHLFASLRQTIESLDKSMEQSILEDSDLEQQYRLLTSIPGIGLQTAVALIVATRNFTRLTDRRKLSCYVGIAPFPYESGSSLSRRKRISKIGDLHLKSLLSMSTWNAIRSVPQLKEFYERKVQEGKSKLSATNAARNKMVGIILSVIKRQTPFARSFFPDWKSSRENNGYLLSNKYHFDHTSLR